MTRREPAEQNEPDEAELREIVEFVLSEAERLGVDQAEAAASHDVGLSVTARLGDVENLEYTNDRGVGVTVYKGTRKGSASTSDFSRPAIREAVEKAFSFARYTAADPCAGLADAELMAGDDLPELDLTHRWRLPVDAAISLAVSCEAAALAEDRRISNSEGASVSSNFGARAYGNSHGFLQSISKTSHSMSCVVVGEAGGLMQRDYWYSAARDPADLEPAEVIGRTAGRRTAGRLGSRKIKTTQAPVVFAPELARGFIGHAIGAIAGGAQYRRASFLLDAAGQKIFPDFFQIQERPHIAKAMASAAFDAEGVATRDRDIVRDGILQGYVLSSYSARRLGLQTTGNAGGAHNLVVPGTVSGQAEMIAGLTRGLLVLELIGQGVNGVTGDYSRGAAGYWIENGEIAFPVHEITIAGNLRELYQRISAVGRDQDLRGGIRCGAVLVDQMTIAGN
ncbi:MAG: metalloprotease PmbA [Gammaproteobacteria bacterium]|nr:metalloprotease PmbA [Gammaproteobacteria bacterium]MDH4253841.1 metalloprotease PmbA [Gammaproteobacteria bacterium]MDH5310434.1 metalloprotease PmbA [Gammaproteobacteria bacterium]